MNTKLLIVDDDADNRDMMVSVFERLNISHVEVLEAKNGIQGFHMAVSQHPSLILLDAVMPGLSGYEVCSLLKAKPEFANTHIVIITAAAGPMSRQQADSAGADSFMLKPLNLLALREIMLRAFDQQSTAA